MRRIQGVIFDFNGTLYWDTSYHNEAWDIFLRKHHIRLTSEEKRHKIHGKLNKDILAGVFGRSLSVHEIEMMVREKEEIYRKIAE